MIDGSSNNSIVVDSSGGGIATNNIWAAVANTGGYSNFGGTAVQSTVPTTFNPVPAPTVRLDRPRYNWSDSPNFEDGTIVEIDLTYYNIYKDKDPKTGDLLQNVVEGIVVGRITISDNFTVYMVDFGEYLFKPTYNYKVYGVPVQAILKPELLPWEK